jgi:hypothetical protein
MDSRHSYTVEQNNSLQQMWFVGQSAAAAAAADDDESKSQSKTKTSLVGKPVQQR